MFRFAGVFALGLLFFCGGAAAQAFIVETPAKEIERVEPIWPTDAPLSALRGKVSVWVDLDDAGSVIAVSAGTGPGQTCSTVTRPDVMAIREAARKAAFQTKFTPAKRDGAAVSSRVIVQYDFNPPVRQSKGDDSYSIKTVAGEVLNKKASSLPAPPYPPAARAVGASGPVNVQILIDENGEVFSAAALSGHPLLRAVAMKAACQARFLPTKLSGVPVKVSGVVVYNFVLQ